MLKACGEAVGLPEGQMGNSEVGHLNLGAGRVVYQDLVKINIACREHKLLENAEIKAAYDYAKANNKQLHLMGLASMGGVHSSLNDVPFIVVNAGDEVKEVKNGKLADVAPTILKLMGIEQPVAMTGQPLV